MPKRALLWGTVLFMLLVAPCHAEDDDAPSLDVVVQQVLDAANTKDEKTLVRLAQREVPDPWTVAETLCVDGAYDAARDFAKAASKFEATKSLSHYVKVRRKVTPDQPFIEMFHQVRAAFGAENNKEVLKLTQPLPAAMPTVLHVRLRDWRATAQRLLEQPAAAAATYAQAAGGARALGWTRKAAGLSLAASIQFSEAKMYTDVLREAEHARSGYARLGAKAKTAEAHGLVGTSHDNTGNLLAAKKAYLATLTLWQELGNSSRVAATRLRLGVIYQTVGDYPEALEHLEVLYAKPEDLEDPADRASLLNVLGYWHVSTGNVARGVGLIEKGLAMAVELGAISVQIQCCIDLGGIYANWGDDHKSIEFSERARKLCEEIGDKAMAGTALLNMGLVYENLDEPDKALAHYEQALALFTSFKDRSERDGEAAARENLSLLLADMGESKRALAFAKEAVAIARAGDSQSRLMSTLESLAKTQHRVGQHSEAIATAQEARTYLRGTLSGLAEGETTFLRGDYDVVFRVGAMAAVQLADYETAVSFIEDGRGMTLATALGSCARDRLPEALRVEESLALKGVTQARAGLERKQTLGTPDTTREERGVDLALDALRQVRDRIRVLSCVGDVIAPEAPPLAALQQALQPGQSFIYYLIDDRSVVALVLDGKRVRAHDLGERDDLEDAIDDLHGSGGIRSRGLQLGAPKGSPRIDPRASLQALLIEPLGLGADVRELIISPAGPIGFVPFGLLLEQPVTLVPSATIWLLLRRNQQARGKGVLALGNPDYAGSTTTLPVQVGGTTLSVLPATEVEAKTVGDVVLLGPDANEKNLRKQLKSRARWRSLHLACHGLLDPSRPRLSALALSRSTKDDDGLLSAVEIFGLPLSADLAVLSACETGRGRVLRGEGIGGLTRAFMYAGVPRVICSLWDVDDEATRALMVKFYELWNPKTGKGLGVAEALSQAQAYIRAQPKWKAPLYWAAWVLWGLPD